MTAISPSELAQMRADIETLLPDTANVITVTYTPDGYGGATITQGTIGTAIPCRMDHKTGRETLTGGAIQDYQGNMLTMPYNTTISTTDRVEYGGNVYAVLAVSEGSWLACKRVTVEKI
jgi:hypothetical protein